MKDVLLVAELQKSTDTAFTRSGAALAVAHMLVDLGDAKVQKMSGADARAYVTTFLMKVPMASSALKMGFVTRLVKACGMYRVPCESVAHYETEIARLAPSEVKGFVGAKPVPAVA